MASFQKRPTGWRAQVRVLSQRDSRVFDTKAEAMAWAAKRETELRSIDAGRQQDPHGRGCARRVPAEDQPDQTRRAMGKAAL